MSTVKNIAAEVFVWIVMCIWVTLNVLYKSAVAMKLFFKAVVAQWKKQHSPSEVEGEFRNITDVSLLK